MDRSVIHSMGFWGAQGGSDLLIFQEMLRNLEFYVTAPHFEVQAKKKKRFKNILGDREIRSEGRI